MAVRTTTIDLERLTQTQVGWIIGRSPGWIRDNSHKFKRNPDGSYDAREVFSTTARILGQVTIPLDVIWEYLEYAKDPAHCKDCKAGRACEFHGPGGCWEPRA